MIHIIKKRMLFFLSVLITGMISVVIGHVRTNYSKDDSLLIPAAHADYALWVDGSGSGGDGCGGCSSDSSSY